MEDDFSATLKTELEQMGYTINVRSKIGRTEVIKVLQDGSFEAVADIRGEDGAEAY